MEVDEEVPVTTSMAETSAVAPDDGHIKDSTVSPVPDAIMASQPVQQVLPPLIQPTVLPPGVPPIVPPVVPPIVPPIAPVVVPPIAAIPPSIPRPLAPLPVRPPVLRQSVPQNGEVRAPSSDSEPDDAVAAKTSSVEYEISEESRLVRERQERAMQELVMKRRAAALAVPTNDMAVRARLRRLGEPITYFGEREMERRDRLRSLMVKLDADGQLERLMKAHEEEEAAIGAATEDADEEMIQYPFYTEGSKALRDARIHIAKYSIARAALRLHRARRKRDDPDEDEDAEMDYALSYASSLTLDSSEFGDDRPLSGCSFSRDGQMLATWYFFDFSCLYYVLFSCVNTCFLALIM